MAEVQDHICSPTVPNLFVNSVSLDAKVNNNYAMYQTPAESTKSRIYTNRDTTEGRASAFAEAESGASHRGTSERTDNTMLIRNRWTGRL